MNLRNLVNKLFKRTPPTPAALAEKLCRYIERSRSTADEDKINTMIDKLLAAGGNLDCIYDGKSPLMTAACAGASSVVRILLSRGASVDYDTPGHFPTTPLVWASLHDHTDCVRRLLVAGAKTEFSDTRGRINILTVLGMFQMELPDFQAATDGYAQILRMRRKETRNMLQAAIDAPKIAAEKAAQEEQKKAEALKKIDQIAHQGSGTEKEAPPMPHLPKKPWHPPGGTAL